MVNKLKILIRVGTILNPDGTNRYPLSSEVTAARQAMLAACGNYEIEFADVDLLNPTSVALGITIRAVVDSPAPPDFEQNLATQIRDIFQKASVTLETFVVKSEVI